ncbi:MAG: SH3 domain-containing protein [Clostridia bacterium]|nr:SH3 domain-containing protein [Clostridia bacterium]
MLKKIIALALVIMGLVGIMIPAAMAENTNVKKYASPVTMYVKSQNGGPLNVRTAPVITKTNCIGQINYGKAVKVIGTAASSSDWVAISFNNRTAFVMVQYLSSVKPTKAEIEQAYITHQMNHFKVITNRFVVIAHPENPATGWVNFRTQPGTGKNVITKLTEGRVLTVTGETPEWYQAIDSVTGKTGFVSKAYVTK